MKSSRLVLAVGMLVAGLAPWSASAGACSCAGPGGPPPVLFEGRAVRPVGTGTVGELWEFDVTRAVRGEVSDTQVAEVDAQREPDASGVVQVSSCALAVRLTAGATYEVGGYMGEARDGGPGMFVNLCGGSVRELEAAPPATGGHAAASAAEEGGTGAWVWAGTGAATVTAAGGALLILRARRRRAAAT